MEQYVIGIDLGTTNCTIAYASKSEPALIKQLSIPQMIAPGQEGEALTLPSFLYFPLDGECANSEAFPGIFARNRGAEIPARMIASAKSWLCHDGIDRREKILPLAGEEPHCKLSPLEACARLLQHLRETWEKKISDAPFHKQQVLITVPASFDPSARQLVQEAAGIAQYPNIILLEEPQAAFYAWLHNHEAQWRTELSEHDTVLVVDIGGGTTDFSLISVENETGNLILKRKAVGSHLLLGGDNIDLSLAYLVKAKFEEKDQYIDDWQFQALTHACRQAKESLMAEDAPKSIDVTIMGRGSRLVKGALKATLNKEEVYKYILDGFIPLLPPQERSPVERRSGIQQIGLPYVQDPRISCQLAKFLSMTGEDESNDMGHFVLPTALLFNGGTMKAHALRTRLVDLLNSWAQSLGKPSIRVLPNPDLDYAVSRGAVYYGLALNGKAIRIKSGTSRSYFIGVEDAIPAVPGISAPLKAVCVVPFGMEEGSQLELERQEFSLVIGQEATFRFFSRATPQLSNDTVPEIGTVVRNWKQELTELHPVETDLPRTDIDGKTVRVKLRSHLTELGVLELWCVAPDGRQWKLEFDLRHNKRQ